MPTINEALSQGWQLQQRGQPVQAEQWYRQVLAVAPHNADAWCYLGMALHDQHRFEEAVQAYRQAIAARPSFPVAYSNLANSLSAAGRLHEAESVCRAAIAQKPDYARAYSNLGAILVKQRRFDEAEQQIRAATSLSPNDPTVLRNLGAVLLNCNRPADAMEPLTKAVALNATPEAYKDLGTANLRLRNLDRALKCFDTALQLDAAYAEAHYARSLVWLLQGDYQRGWDEYEWRWRRPGFSKPNMGRPEWDGTSLNGQSILVVAEQGLGDTIQFIRYASVLKEDGATVFARCPQSLKQRLQSCPHLDAVISDDETLPHFDVFAPLLSIPRVLKSTATTIPVGIPYLRADDVLCSAWSKRLGDFQQLRVGIAWQGSRDNQADAIRSVPLAEFAPLAQSPDVQLFSLQKGDGRDQIGMLREPFALIDLNDELDENTGPFMDTAAVMKNLDLVVCCDTAIGHLAGALGVPVWIALPFAPDWRWLLDRDDSPWYPTARLFRQPSPGDWSSVFGSIAGELATMASQFARKDRLA